MSSRPAIPLNSTVRRAFIDRVAPQYWQASSSQKALLLDTVVATTGYARKYAIRLLNQVPQGKHSIQRRRLPRYGQDMQQALVTAWKAARHICPKRLIPFLPTLLPLLERHGHLTLTPENRGRLLSMSTATAERLLRSHRASTPRGVCCTQAGPLLKEQIPIRTFHSWDNAQPGFLEADLVAHNGGDSEGCSLYTFTLTDVATGWTECLPLLYKNPEVVLAAFQQARALFPFPILGLDTDNGSEFINEALMRYCQAQRITFTRGRPDLKADQCFVEQKNRAIVRQFVGFERLVGQHASRQLRELYRAVRLYVNCFQPSMKLLSKQHEGGKIHRVYDPAKTPLERLLLSGILPEDVQQHVQEVAQSLDPLNLLRHLEELQQALWRPSRHALPHLCAAPSVSLVPFCVERCLPGSFPSQNKRVDPPKAQPTAQGIMDLFDSPRSMKDPFEGVWDVILRSVLAHPDWSGRQVFRELQRLFPGRYQPSQLPTLQQGVRKIRAHLLALMEEPWPQEVIQASVLPIEPPADQQDVASLPTPVCSPQSPLSHAQAGAYAGASPPVIEEANPLQVDVHEPMHPSSTQESQQAPDLQLHHLTMTIEDAIQAYLQEQRKNGRRRKTLQWHQTALGFLQQYLVKERHLCFLTQITQSEVRGWVTFLRTSSSDTRTPRRASTIATYGRSARAFCHWAVRNGYLDQTPITRGILPKGGKKRLEVLERDVFERLSLSCRPEGNSGTWVDDMAARNRALLWIFFDTGMRASELRGLRLGDVDCDRRRLHIAEQGHERWLTLSSDGWYQLLSYLEQYRLKAGRRGKEHDEDEPLFLSETYEPLTNNALTLVFHRLSKRAGITQQRITPSLLRDSFAIQYLQAGGEPATLRDLLGLKDRGALHRYERFLAQSMEPQEPKESTEGDVSRSSAAPHKRKRRRSRASSTAPRTHQ